MKDNKGYSLVELIIVIGILAVVSGITFYGLTLLSGQYAKEVANNLSSVLETEKNYAQTRSAEADCYVEISYDADGGLYAEYFAPEKVVGNTMVSIEKRKIGSSRVTLEFVGGGSTYTLGQSEKIQISFDRVSGGFKSFETSTGITVACDEIFVKQGGRTYKFTLYKATGKHVMERVMN